MYGTPQFAQRGGTYLTGAPLSRSPRRRLQRFSGLGALTADQAVEQIFPAAQVRSSAGHNAGVRSLMVQAVQAGQMLDARGNPAYIPGTVDCAASGVSSNIKLAQISGTMALTGLNVAAAMSTAVGTAIGAALGPLTMGISTIIGLLPIFFGHHAQAVKKEQSTLCTAVPAANNYLQVIDQAVQSGASSPADGVTALSSLLSGFQSQVQSIMHGTSPTSSGECNAACVMYSQLAAIVAYRASVYQDMASQQAASPVGSALAPVTSALQSAQAAATSAGLPAWLLPAAGFFVLWEVL
jgi:hypothetical protein